MLRVCRDLKNRQNTIAGTYICDHLLFDWLGGAGNTQCVQQSQLPSAFKFRETIPELGIRERKIKKVGTMAAASGSIPADLAQQVSHCMSQLALPNPPDLKAVEQTLVSLAKLPGFGQAMATIVSDQQANAQQQNLAAILLRELSVGKYWAMDPDTAFVVPDAEKDVIRQVIVNGLLSSISVVRIQSATAIAHIGSMDWPEQWPGLLDQLLNWASGNAPVQGDMRNLVIDGALRTLVYFTEHIGSDHIISASRVILPVIMGVWRDVSALDTVLKCKFATKVIAIVQGLLSALAPLAHAKDADAQSLVKEIIPHALAVAGTPLSLPQLTPSACRVKQAVLDLLGCVLEHFAKALDSHALPLVQSLVSFIARIGAAYERVDIAGGEVGQSATGAALREEVVPGDETSPDYDSEHSEQSLSAVSMHATGLLVRLITAPNRKMGKLLHASATELVGLVLPFMQIPAETLDDWLDDPDAFVSAEEEDSLDASLRGNVIDFVGDAYREWDFDALGAVALHCLAVLSPSGTRGGAAAAWKMQEAALLVLGHLGPQFCYVSQAIESKQAQGGAAGGAGGQHDGLPSEEPLPVAAFVDLLYKIVSSDGACLGATGASVPSLGAAQVSPCDEEQLRTGRIFLVGRALWAAGRFASRVPSQLLEPLLQACLSGLSRSHPIPLQLAACESMARFVRLLKKSDAVSQDALDSVASQAVDRLVALVVGASEGTLFIPLTTLRSTMWASPAVTAAKEAQLGPLVLGLWIKYLSDPGMHEVMIPCMRSLLRCGHDGAVQAFGQRLLTPLHSILGNVHSVDPGVAESACTVLTGVLSAAPDGLKPHLMELFPLASRMVTAAHPDDTSSIRSGVDVLTAYMTHLRDHVAAWRGEGGVTGPSLVARAMVAALQGNVSDHGIMDVPDGIMALILSDVGVGAADAVALGKALAVRLAAAKTATPMLNCVVAFAGLLHNADVAAALLPELQQVAVPLFRDTMQAAEDRTKGRVVTEQEPALMAVLRAWMHVMPFVVGSARRNMTSLGLVRLLGMEGMLQTLLPVTVASTVAEPPARQSGDGYALRSKGSQHLSTNVPLPVEMGLQLCASLLAAESGEDDDEGDEFGWGDEGGSDDDEGVSAFVDAEEMKFLSDMVGADGGWGGGIMDMGQAVLIEGEGDPNDELYMDEEEEEDDSAWLQVHPWRQVDLVVELKTFLRKASEGGALGALLGQVTKLLPQGKLAAVQKCLQQQ